MNLTTNALKYCESNVSVQLCPSKTDTWLRLNVIDDGPGVDLSLEESLFEPFTVGELSNVGTGVGLFIVKQMCVALGGDCGYLRLTDPQGAIEGSAFWIEFPSNVKPDVVKLEVDIVTGIDTFHVITHDQHPGPGVEMDSATAASQRAR